MNGKNRLYFTIEKGQLDSAENVPRLVILGSHGNVDDKAQEKFINNVMAPAP